MTKETRKLKFRRRRKGKTNYAKRLALLKSGKKRVVFRKSNKGIIVQLIEFSANCDKTLFSVNSNQLKKFGFPGKCNIPSAYLAGYFLGKKALSSGISEAVFDIGTLTPVHGNRAFAALKGLVDAGLKVPCSEEVFPKQERIEGVHIEKYAKKEGNIRALFNEAKQRIDELTQQGKEKVKE